MNNSTTSLVQYQIIEKEEVQSIHFPKDDVLKTAQEQSSRSAKIHRATSLGNIENYKVHILFLDKDQNKYRIFTTIWAHTTKNVVLKKGETIPVHSIVDIQE